MLAAELMNGFAARTGLTTAASAAAPARRYLWTDAFAVCNFLGLARATGDAGYTELARRLVDLVHGTLGRHRDDDPRRGWISGLSEADGAEHPTLGGLRIGKPLPERPRGEPVDQSLEWDRDGQYFHYLTRWMHALDQLARVTGEERFLRHALELAEAAHQRFVHGPRGQRRMYWKMSIDLMRPQLASMGHHDPLDGYVTCLALEVHRVELGARGPDLGDAIAEFRAMIEPEALATGDPLGIGGLLVDAHRLTQLERDPGLRDAIIRAAELGLAHYAGAPDLQRPASQRLGFRELGLAIGLSAAARIARYAGLGRAIEAFWLHPDHRRAATWVDHLDINEVMLATCLLPEGFLGMLAPGSAAHAARAAR
ncbi:MAG TPA: hypothetical protein VF469_31280 [Kofleriaceae bacterium]